MIPTLDQWLEWKTLCEQARCSPDTASALSALGVAHVHRILNTAGYDLSRAGGLFAPFVASSSDPTAWSYLENQCNTGHHQTGKRYKDWLFDQALGHETPEHRCNSLSKGTELLLVNILRAIAGTAYRQEKREADLGFISTSTPIGNDGEDSGSLTIEHLLESKPLSPSLLKPEEEHEFEVIADRMTRALFNELNRREKLALLSFALDWSAADPRLLRAARCRKSQFYDARNKSRERIVQAVDEKYSTEDVISRMYLSRKILEQILALLVGWLRSEKSLKPILNEWEMSLAQQKEPEKV